METYKIENKAYALKNTTEDAPAIHPIKYQIGWDDYEIVGSPTVASDNVVDGFSTSNYVKTKELLDLGTNFEFRTRFKVNSLSSVQRVFDGVSGCYLLVQITTSGAMRYAVGDGSSYYNLLNGSNAILRNGYWFEVKITFDGSTYKAYISNDHGTTWLEDWSYESTMIIPPFIGVFGISRDLTNCVNAGRIALGSQNTWFKITKNSTLKLSDLITIVGNPNITSDGILNGIDDSNYIQLPNTVDSYFDVGSEWQLNFKTFDYHSITNTYVFGAPWYTSIWIMYDKTTNLHNLVAQDWGQTTNTITTLIPNMRTGAWYTIKFKKPKNQLIEYYYNGELVGTTIPANVGATNMSYCRLGKIGAVNTYMTGSYDLTNCYVKPAGSIEPIYLAEKHITITQYYVLEENK